MALAVGYFLVVGAVLMGAAVCVGAKGRYARYSQKLLQVSAYVFIFTALVLVFLDGSTWGFK